MGELLDARGAPRGPELDEERGPGGLSTGSIGGPDVLLDPERRRGVPDGEGLRRGRANGEHGQGSEDQRAHPVMSSEVERPRWAYAACAEPTGP